MVNKKKIIITTLFSAILFCMVIVFVSLSPLADLGENANQFNSIGMWMAIIMMLIPYLFPLLLYGLGLEWIKYIMAVFCSLGILSLVLMMILVVFIGALKGIILSLLGVLIVCGLNLLVNFIWLYVAFSKDSNDSEIHST